EKVGERIGYQVRMDSVQSDRTRILIVTEGILTRKLQNDPALEDVALVIFDEFHERSLHADLSLALALESQTVLREDLKLLIMSATLNTSAISALLENAPVVKSKGRMYPVETIYLDTHTPQPSKKTLNIHVAKRVLKCLEEEEGNILVFLPGIGQIKAVEKHLLEAGPENTYISALYGNLSKEAQDRAIKAPPKGKQKVVLSTNIAQTSLTIEGISVVIDSGLQNVSVFNPFSGMDRLETEFISEDAATQRAGRAGRLRKGKAYRLWHSTRILPPISLSSFWNWPSGAVPTHTLSPGWIPRLLLLCTMPKVCSCSWVLWTRKETSLDKEGNITPHGKAMSRYGLHPRLAHMMLKAREPGLSYEASLLAVLITEKDILTSSYANADLRERLQILHDVAQHKPVDSRQVNIPQCRHLLKLAKKIVNTAGLASTGQKQQKQNINTELLGILLAFAYPDRIAQLRHTKGNTYLLSNGKGAHLHNEDTLFGSSYLVISDLDAKSTNATIYKALPLTLAQIEEYLETVSLEKVTWNEEQARVEMRSVEMLGKLTLKERQLQSTDSPEVTEVLLDELEAMGLEVLRWSKEATKLRERINFLHRYDTSFPDFSDAYLIENLEIWLSPYLTDISTLKAVRTLDLYSILLGRLSYEQTRTLERLAPAKLRVASGSHISIDYSDPAQPVLAVRLQEMFGTVETPTVMNGKVKLMLHLLSPAHRPMQVTQDLANFWETTYIEVRKELRGKYKKHYWPDDPLVAVATNRTKKRM
ncbi:MAG: ATP-dependent helicase HrpB, partial [Epsilonproteobacteria bacterium 4484_20]